MAPAPTVIHPPAPVTQTGRVPVLDRIKTNEKIVFITIDDGGWEEAPTARLLKRAGIPITAFLVSDFVRIKAHPEFYGQISQNDGQVIQDHTVHHVQLPTLSLAKQRQEICGDASALERWYGARPYILRPPFGAFNADTLQAAKECGMQYLTLWTVNLPEGGLGYMQYQSGRHLVPGDIILVHWAHNLHKDLAPALRDIARQGFKVAALQDYLPRVSAQ